MREVLADVWRDQDEDTVQAELSRCWTRRHQTIVMSDESRPLRRKPISIGRKIVSENMVVLAVAPEASILIHMFDKLM